MQIDIKHLLPTLCSVYEALCCRAMPSRAVVAALLLAALCGGFPFEVNGDDVSTAGVRIAQHSCFSRSARPWSRGLAPALECSQYATQLHCFETFKYSLLQVQLLRYLSDTQEHMHVVGMCCCSSSCCCSVLLLLV
jgi:hypothetical protein